MGSIDTDYYRNKQTNLLSTNPKVLVQDLDILESKMEGDARRQNNKSNYENYGSSTSSNNSGGDSGNYTNSYNNGNRQNQREQQERGSSFFMVDEIGRAHV